MREYKSHTHTNTETFTHTHTYKLCDEPNNNKYNAKMVLIIWLDLSYEQLYVKHKLLSINHIYIHIFMMWGRTIELDFYSGYIHNAIVILSAFIVPPY